LVEKKRACGNAQDKKSATLRTECMIFVVKQMRQRSPHRRCILATALVQDVILFKSIMNNIGKVLLCMGGYHATFKIKSAKGIR
jgi:hypothetical protein